MRRLKDRKIVIIITTILFLGLIVLGILMLFKNANPNTQWQVRGIQTQQGSNPLDREVLSERDQIPLKNTIYLGQYENEYFIFYTDNDKQKYFENGSEKTSPMIGNLIGRSRGFNSFDYNKLQNPIRIYTFQYPNKLNTIGSILLAEDNSYLYISNIFIDQNKPSAGQINEVFRVNILDKKMDFLWSRKIWDDKYGDKRGAAHIDFQIDNKFLVLQINICYECDASNYGALILNLTTKAEKYLGEVGDININPSNNTFTYRKLANTTEACTGSYNCVNGSRVVKKPAGDTLMGNLP